LLKHWLTLGLTSALAIIVLAIPALAASNNKYQFRGNSAYAYFEQYDDCNYTYVSVNAFDNVTKSGSGTSTSQKEAYVYYSKYNYCTGIGSYSYGSVINPNFNTQGGLKSASLNTIIPLYDENTGTSKTAQVNLTWTSTGDTFRGKYQSQNQAPGYMFRYRSNGSWSDAQIAGSLTIDGTNVIENLSSYASLNQSNSGSIEIIKK
jgi:hypothetical protein